MSDDHSHEKAVEPSSRPAAKKLTPRKRSAAIVQKSFPMVKDTTDALEQARLDWHMDDRARFEAFGNQMASENAFVQACLMFAFARIKASKKEAEMLLQYFPDNIRRR